MEDYTIVLSQISESVAIQTNLMIEILQVLHRSEFPNSSLENLEKIAKSIYFSYGKYGDTQYFKTKKYIWDYAETYQDSILKYPDKYRYLSGIMGELALISANDSCGIYTPRGWAHER